MARPVTFFQKMNTEVCVNSKDCHTKECVNPKECVNTKHCLNTEEWLTYSLDQLLLGKLKYPETYTGIEWVIYVTSKINVKTDFTEKIDMDDMQLKPIATMMVNVIMEVMNRKEPEKALSVLLIGLKQVIGKRGESIKRDLLHHVSQDLDKYNITNGQPWSMFLNERLYLAHVPESRCIIL